jgi:hypothetical protein
MPKSAKKALGDLIKSLSTKRTTNVLVAADVEGSSVAQRLALHDDLAHEFRSTAGQAANDFAAFELKPFEEGYTPEPHERFFLRLDEEESLPIRETVELVSQIAKAEQFVEAGEMISSLRFYSIVVGSDAAQARGVFLRAYSPKRELTRSSGFAAMMAKGTYNRVTQKVFLFDREVDCFAWDNHLFINDIGNFRRIFRYFDQLRASAAAIVDDIAAKIPIANEEEFKAQCVGQLQMIAKLATISRRQYLSKVTMADIKRTIETFDLPVKTLGSGKNEKLVFDPHPSTRWIILKLLDDDYLGSIMTDEKYAVSSKTKHVK